MQFHIQEALRNEFITSDRIQSKPSSSSITTIETEPRGFGSGVRYPQQHRLRLKPCHIRLEIQYHRPHNYERLLVSFPRLRCCPFPHELRRPARGVGPRKLLEPQVQRFAPQNSTLSHVSEYHLFRRSRLRHHYYHVVSKQSTVLLANVSSPVSLLHVTSQDNIAIRSWPRNHVSLIVFSMSHYVRVNLRCSCQEDLTSGRIAFRILYTRQFFCCVTYAIEHNLGRRVREGCLNFCDLLPRKSHAVLLKLSIKVQHVCRRIDGQGCKGQPKFRTFRQISFWELSELSLVSICI